MVDKGGVGFFLYKKAKIFTCFTCNYVNSSRMENFFYLLKENPVCSPDICDNIVVLCYHQNTKYKCVNFLGVVCLQQNIFFMLEEYHIYKIIVVRLSICLSVRYGRSVETT